MVPDPARLAECPQGERPFPKLRELVAFTLVAPATVRLQDSSTRILPAGTEIVLFDTVLDRDEAAAVFIVGLRGDKQRCASAVLYVTDWGKAAGAR